MKWRWCCAVLLAGLPILGLAETTSQDALMWLTRMSRAMQSNNYAGNFVYMHNGKIESLRVRHYADRQGEYEHLVHLNGNAREVIRNNDIVTCVFPEEGIVLVEKRRGSSYLPPVLQSGNVASIGAYYNFLIGPEGRVAGQLARLIEVRPRDNDRYGYRFWINVRNGLLMRSDLVNEQGALVEQILFTDLQEVAPVPRSHVRPLVDTRNFTWQRQDLAQQVNQPGSKDWVLRNLPEGFTIAEVNARMVLPNNTVVKHFVVSDGLAAISVYIQSADEGSRKRMGSNRIGGLNVHTAITSGYQITALGDAPLTTVRRIAEATQYRGGGHD